MATLNGHRQLLTVSVAPADVQLLEDLARRHTDGNRSMAFRLAVRAYGKKCGVKAAERMARSEPK